MEDGVKGLGELLIVIADHKPERRVASLEFPDQLARLLSDPGRVRIRCTAGEVNAPRTQLKEEENVDRLQEEGLDGEEIAGQ